MPLYGQSLVVDYFAYNSTTGQGKTGDAANHSVFIRKDGGSLQSYTGTITEVDATNAPGLYSITLSGTDMQANKVTVFVKSSTSNVVIIPVEVFTESGRLDAAVSSRATAADVWSYASRTLTSFGTLVNDIATAVWSYAARSLTDVSNIASAVWSYATRSLTDVGNIASAVWSYTARSLTDVSNIASAVWSYVVESTYTALKVLRLLASVELGARTVSGSTYTHKGIDGTTTRVVGTVDSGENRSITTLNGD